MIVGYPNFIGIHNELKVAKYERVTVGYPDFMGIHNSFPYLFNFCLLLVILIS